MPKHAGFREREYRLAESEMRRCDPTSSRQRECRSDGKSRGQVLTGCCPNEVCRITDTPSEQKPSKSAQYGGWAAKVSSRTGANVLWATAP
jgi:hypothetical protein